MIKNLYDRCFDFVEEQSCGEWGDDIVAQDAVKLAEFVRSEIAMAMPAELRIPKQ